MSKIFLILVVLFSSLPVLAVEKSRVIVLTDIGEDPDDQQSLVRFLLYSSDYDVEGIIATTAVWMRGNKNGQPVNPAPEYIHEILNAYARIENNLRSHSARFSRAKDYPAADYLRRLVFAGNSDRGSNQNFGMDDVGAGLSSAGSNHIIEVLEKEDSRPVWILIWGGANTLAQSVYDIVNSSRDTAEKERLLSKIRAYDIAGQDDAGGWIACNYPGIFYMRSVRQYMGMVYQSCYEYNKNSFIYRSDHCPKPKGQYCCQIQDDQGGNPDIFTPGWIEAQIKQSGHPLGDVYPRKGSAWSEGQSPSFLYLVNNGLSYPDSIAWGGWGGRFERIKGCGLDAQCDEAFVLPHDYKKSYCMYVPASDWAYTPRVGGYTMNRLAPVFRFREAMSWDFKARMDWAVKPVGSANHNPVCKVRGHPEGTLFLEAAAGETLKLDASSSFDPDGDSLKYNWWIYHEAGIYAGHKYLKKKIIGWNNPKIEFRVPEDAKSGDCFHLILELSDNGSPVLQSYRRMVVLVNNGNDADNLSGKIEKGFVATAIFCSDSSSNDPRCINLYRERSFPFDLGNGISLLLYGNIRNPGIDKRVDNPVRFMVGGLNPSLNYSFKILRSGNNTYSQAKSSDVRLSVTNCTSGKKGEFLIVDEEFTYSDSLNGFKWWNINEIDNAPSNWKSPYDYEFGQIYERYEIISQASNRPAKLQFVFWQDKGARESLSSHAVVNGKGSLVTRKSSPSTWWEKDNARPLDFSRPGDFLHLGIPLWSDNTRLVTPWSSVNDWSLRDKYHPMTIRASIVAVAKGYQFSGWDHWIGGYTGRNSVFNTDSITVLSNVTPSPDGRIVIRLSKSDRKYAEISALLIYNHEEF